MPFISTSIPDKLGGLRPLLLSLFIIFQTANTYSQISKSAYTISYYSPYFTQVGTKIGASFFLADVSKKGISKEIRISPQLGFFSQLGISQNYLLNTELSLLRKRDSKKRFQSFGLGLAYLVSSKSLGPIVDLGSAGVSSASRETDSFITPSLNYSLGLSPSKGPAYQFSLFLGKKFSLQDKGELFFGFETGIILNN